MTNKITGGLDAAVNRYIKEPAPHKLHLFFHECPIEVSSNSVRLVSKLKRYYSAFSAQGETKDKTPQIKVTAIEAIPPDLEADFVEKRPDPGKANVKEEYVDLEGIRIVRKKLTGMVFLFGERGNFSIGPALENYNQVVNFINNRYMEFHLNSGYLLSHAAGVDKNGEGIAVAGCSGAGKSTLVLHLMRRGLKYVSNDRLLIQRGGETVRMLGVPKLPRVNPGTILNNPSLYHVIPENDLMPYLRLPPDDLWTLEKKYDIFLDDCFGKERIALSSNISLVCVLNWSRDKSSTKIEEVDLHARRDLLGMLMKSVGLFFMPGNGKLNPDFSERAYLKCLYGCRVFELSGGIDFDRAADYCIKLLEGG